MSTYNNDHHEYSNGYLPGSEEAEMNSLLNELGRVERASAPAQLDTGVLDAIAAAIAPGPLAIEPPPAEGSLWFGSTLRYTAAAVLVGGLGLSVLLVRPWNTPAPAATAPNMIAVALEADVESLLALDEMTTDLDESVAEWTLWAQAVDTDLNSAWTALDLIDSSLDGNGAL